MRKRPFFHFQQLGYRQNPFGALTAAEWVRAAVLPDGVATAVLNAAEHVQVLGPKGIGKSTTLRKAAALLAERGETAVYEYVPEGQDYFVSEVGPGVVFALDEAQRLARGERARLRTLASAQNVRLLLGSHADLAAALEGTGRKWRTLRLSQIVDAAHVEKVLAARLAAFAVPGRERVEMDTAVAPYLFNRFGQDLREMEYFLYEVWQSLTQICVVDVAYLERFGE